MLENTEGAIKNGKSRETGNIQGTQDKEKQNTTQYKLGFQELEDGKAPFGRQQYYLVAILDSGQDIINIYNFGKRGWGNGTPKDFLCRFCFIPP